MYVKYGESDGSISLANSRLAFMGNFDETYNNASLPISRLLPTQIK